MMLTETGSIKVMDFGIAHVLGSARQTREKTIVGTLEYVKVGSATVITTSPREYLDSLPAKRGFTAEETAAQLARVRRKGDDDRDPPPLAAE